MADYMPWSPLRHMAFKKNDAARVNKDNRTSLGGESRHVDRRTNRNARNFSRLITAQIFVDNRFSIEQLANPLFLQTPAPKSWISLGSRGLFSAYPDECLFGFLSPDNVGH